MKRFSFLLIKLFAASILFTSCLGKNDNPNEFANEQFYAVMDQYYLWYNYMPGVNPKNYRDPADLLEALRYNQLDRWSYITTKQQLQAYFEEGVYIGFGFGSAFDQSGNLWITYIFNNSPLSNYNIKRGWRIRRIDGTVPTPQNIGNLFGPPVTDYSCNFEFVSPTNEVLLVTFSKKSITMNTVLRDSVYDFGSSKIGYFVLKGFILPTIDELNAVFQKFKTQNVNDVIVDLRYNGGGRMNVANHLGGLIAGNIANNQVFTKLVNNDKNQVLNFNDTIKTKPASLTGINRIVFITTSGSASASESLINGLKPYMNVITVGSKTHGKPVGMYSFTSNSFDWAFVPICFFINNSLNQGYYFDGIPVNFNAADDITTDFGVLSESSLNSALGALGAVAPKIMETNIRANYHPKFGLEQEIDAW